MQPCCLRTKELTVLSIVHYCTVLCEYTLAISSCVPLWFLSNDQLVNIDHLHKGVKDHQQFPLQLSQVPKHKQHRWVYSLLELREKNWYLWGQTLGPAQVYISKGAKMVKEWNKWFSDQVANFIELLKAKNLLKHENSLLILHMLLAKMSCHIHCLWLVFSYCLLSITIEWSLSW